MSTAKYKIEKPETWVAKLDKANLVSLREALDLMGLSRSSSQAQFKARYASLMKQWHPDVSKHPLAKEMSAILNKAAFTLQQFRRGIVIDKGSDVVAGPPPVTELPKDWQNIYKSLDSFIRDEDSPEQMIRFMNFMHRQPAAKQDEYMAVWSILLQHRKSVQAYNAQLAGRAHRLRKQALERVLAPNNERAIMYAREYVDMALMSMYIRSLNIRMMDIFNKVTFNKERPYVPIMLRTHEYKPRYPRRWYRRFIALSAALIVAILGGKYIWDSVRKGYMPNPYGKVTRTYQLR